MTDDLDIVFLHEANRMARDRVVEIEREMGRRIAELRRAHRMSQAALAPAIGVDNSTVTRIETGQRSLRYGEAVLLAKALGLSIDGIERICAMCAGSPPSGFTCNHLRSGGGVVSRRVMWWWASEMTSPWSQRPFLGSDQHDNPSIGLPIPGVGCLIVFPPRCKSFPPCRPNARCERVRWHFGWHAAPGEES